jgi:hypothetical protein
VKKTFAVISPVAAFPKHPLARWRVPPTDRPWKTCGPFFPSPSLSAALSSIASAQLLEALVLVLQRPFRDLQPAVFRFPFYKNSRPRSHAADVYLAPLRSFLAQNPAGLLLAKRLRFIRPSPSRDGLYFTSRRLRAAGQFWMPPFPRIFAKRIDGSRDFSRLACAVKTWRPCSVYRKTRLTISSIELLPKVVDQVRE